MAILQVRSTNPNLSFLIKKNPASGMQIKNIRKGLAYGWYSDAQSYAVLFKDSDTELSYQKQKNEAFAYLNTSRYNTPLFPLNAISEFFGSAYKKRNEQDCEGYEHQLMVNLVHIDADHYIEFFNRHFSSFQIEIVHQAHKSYQLTIRTTRSLHDLLHFANLLFLFLSLLGDEYLDVNDDVIKKYLQCIQLLDAPYYIRYLYARNVLNNRGTFKTFKKELEKTNRNQITLAFGGTSIQRRDRIKELLGFNKSILDIGCGEGFYAIPFSKNIESHFYYAVDIDEDSCAIVNRKANNGSLENIITYGALDDFLSTYNGEKVDVILTEVVEHMPCEEAAQLIRSVLKHVQFDRFVITTPNRDFNENYLMEGFRHHDHKWEMTTDEFESWIGSIVPSSFASTFLQIGDAVDGIYTTQGVLLQGGGNE